MTDLPFLSIVIVRFAGGSAIDEMISALNAQLEARRDVEVLVLEHEEASALPLRHGEQVRRLRLPNGSGPSKLRSYGVTQSRGRYVALTEDHCVPTPGWCAAIEAGHRAGHDVVGGPIAPASSLHGRDLALYLLAYGRYQPPMAAGPSSALSDCNVSYRRERLEEIAAVWRDAFVETDVHAALMARGVSLYLLPDAVVVQGRRVDLRDAAREQGVHGAEYARGRAHRVSPVRRLVFVAGALLLPALITLRVVRRARGMSYRQIAGSLPAVLRLATAWSFGELRGYLDGTPPA